MLNPTGLPTLTDTELQEVVHEAREILGEMDTYFPTVDTPAECSVLSDFYATVYLHKLSATSSLTLRSQS